MSPPRSRREEQEDAWSEEEEQEDARSTKEEQQTLRKAADPVGLTDAPDLLSVVRPLLDNPRLAVMLMIKVGYDSLTDGSQLTMHKFDTWTAKEQRALVCRFLIDRIGEGVLPVIISRS